jgi:hypothetical protein
MFGVGIDDCEQDEIKDIRYRMKEIINDISSNKSRLNAMNVIVRTNKRSGFIQFENINMTNLLDFTNFLTEILNSIGEAYISDFESCIDYYDIIDTLE